MNGSIFSIQRFSIHDGPGIRTTVFMKGCNLKCFWCHNPESQMKEKQIMFRKGKCTGCGRCSTVCPHPFDLSKCTACGKCAQSCPNGAREECGYEISDTDLMTEILKDRDYYDTSGGGVTFSGGEPLIQPEFLLEVLKECKKYGMNTAIETAANVPFNVFERILPYTDMVICDIKSLDTEKHRRGTGYGNELIISNAEKLRDMSETHVLFRMPYIPGYNSDEVRAVSAFAGNRKLELMPYHSICASKYEALGRDFPAKDIVLPAEDELEEVSSACGNVFFTKHIIN